MFRAAEKDNWHRMHQVIRCHNLKSRLYDTKQWYLFTQFLTQVLISLLLKRGAKGRGDLLKNSKKVCAVCVVLLSFFWTTWLATTYRDWVPKPAGSTFHNWYERQQSLDQESDSPLVGILHMCMRPTNKQSLFSVEHYLWTKIASEANSSSKIKNIITKSRPTLLKVKNRPVRAGNMIKDIEKETLGSVLWTFPLNFLLGKWNIYFKNLFCVWPSASVDTIACKMMFSCLACLAWYPVPDASVPVGKEGDNHDYSNLLDIRLEVGKKKKNETYLFNLDGELCLHWRQGGGGGVHTTWSNIMFLLSEPSDLADITLIVNRFSSRDTGGNDFDLIITVEETFRCTASSSVKSQWKQLIHP